MNFFSIKFFSHFLLLGVIELFNFFLEKENNIKRQRIQLQTIVLYNIKKNLIEIGIEFIFNRFFNSLTKIKSIFNILYASKRSNNI